MTSNSTYEIVLLGTISDAKRDTLRSAINDCIEDFELLLDRDVAIRLAEDMAERNIKAATVAAYFWDGVLSDEDETAELIAANVPVIPITPEGVPFSTLPGLVSGANAMHERADDPSLSLIASALLECVGLLRQQRRIFVSYRRQDSRAAAVQLHDKLSSRCFDVFLDTHDIRPGKPFQDELWNCLIDCDVMVMIDTPTYFESHWTSEEFSRALGKNIQILRVVWPGHRPLKETEFSETLFLDDADLHGANERAEISDDRLEEIVNMAERLRSRSIAARHRAIAGRLKAEVAGVGGRIDGLGAHWTLHLTLLNGESLWAYPVVGLPNAEILNDIAVKSRDWENTHPPLIVYDHLGMHDRWCEHLKWLNDEIGAVDLVNLDEARDLLKSLGGAA